MTVKPVPSSSRPRKALKQLPQPCAVIQEAMHKQKITRRQLAEAMDITYGMACDIVSGRRVCNDYEDDLERVLQIPTGTLDQMNRALLQQAVRHYTETIIALRMEGRRYLGAESRRAKFRAVGHDKRDA